MDIICKHETTKNISPNFFQIHTHGCFEIFFMIKGAGNFLVEGHKYPILPNSMVILRPGEMHRAEIQSGHVYERCYLHFYEETVQTLDPDGKLLSPFCDRLLGQNNYFGPDDIDSVFIKNILLKSVDLISKNQEGNKNLSHYLFVLLNEIYDSFRSIKQGTVQKFDYDKQVYEIIQYINNNITNRLSVSEIEKMFFISRPSLYKRFKAATGTTIWDYIVTKRIVLANQMINGGESATQAAYACGFNDYSSFYRAYFKIFNRPPSRTK